MTIVVALPSLASAQAGGLVPCSGPDCNTNDVVAFANSMIEYLIKGLGVIAVIVMVYAGFKMVTSAGDETAWTKAKELFGNVIIGIILILAAWLIVDTILKGLTSQGLNEWSQKLQMSDVPNPNNTPIVGNTPKTGTGNGSYNYASGIASQSGHASSKLNSLLSCVSSNVDFQYTLTSISDSKIVNGTKTWAQCRAGGQSAGCAHSSGSKHYGTANEDRSYAADIRVSNLSSTQQNAIRSAASTCGGSSLHEGDHIHISA